MFGIITTLVMIPAAVPSLCPHREVLALAATVFIILINLRGVRESGKFFAFPTYFGIGILREMWPDNSVVLRSAS